MKKNWYQTHCSHKLDTHNGVFKLYWMTGGPDIKYNIVYELHNLFTGNYHVRLAYSRFDRIVQKMDSTL